MSDLVLDCFSGIAGDMLVGALLDLGADFAELERGLAGLGVGGYRLERRSVRRGAIAATKFDVHLDGAQGEDPGAVHAHPHHDHDHAHDHDAYHDHLLEHGRGHRHEHGHPHPHEHTASRGLAEITRMLDAAPLPHRVKERSLAAFRLLAEAEGKVHGVTPEEVHFHEVGAVDAICDIVGACLALESLGVERIFVGPLRVGSGFVRCEHGKMPVPAPGTLGCLSGFDVQFETGRGELVTPTGACLVGALAKPAMPSSFTIARVGYGAGTRDPEDVPNVLRAVLGRVPAKDAESLVELSTNLDHLPPTLVAVAVDAALAAGAADAFTIACTMKKGRPGHLLVALVPSSRVEDVESAIFRETATLGIRRVAVERTILERESVSVDTSYGAIRVKLGRHRGVVTSCVPEFEDCRAAADRAGAPVADVVSAARRAYERL
jgi:pyridinium-3,5-bisthiocarboxylic acid mononucleotide nickel chelatase